MAPVVKPNMHHQKTVSFGSKYIAIDCIGTVCGDILTRKILRIPRFQGQSEFTLSGEAELSAMTHKKAWSRPPIAMDFQVLMFTSSGLLVRFLKVFEKSGYQSVKWVRYMTKAGTYQIRVSASISLDKMKCYNVFTNNLQPQF